MSATEIARPANRSEWLRLRHGFANASDAAVYMGCHPYKSLADLAMEKMAEGPIDASNRDMERGNRLEAVVADWWADEHGLAVFEPEVMYVAGRLLATLDRRIVGVEQEALEVKTTRKHVTGVEDYWWWQAQAQMLCADLDRVHFAVLDGDLDLLSFEVDRDDEAIDQLMKRVNAFWDAIDLGMTPEGADFTAEHITKLHPEPTPGSYVEVDDEQFAAIVEWEQLRQARIHAETVEKEAKDRVARLVADNEGARYGDAVCLTFKANKPSAKCDYKALEADEPELVEKYRRLVPGPRVLRFVGGEG